MNGVIEVKKMNEFGIPHLSVYEPVIINLIELNFTIFAIPHDNYVEFVIYDIEGWEESENQGIFVPLWNKASAAIHQDTVKTVTDYEPYLHGTVRFDGCSNWHFDEQDRVMLHGCSRRDVLRFGEVMAYCWDIAAVFLSI